MDFSSKLLEQAVYEMSQLPGIGKRTALRLVLHLLRQSEGQTVQLADALLKVRTEIKFVKIATTFLMLNFVRFVQTPIVMRLLFVWLKMYVMLWRLKTLANTGGNTTF